MIGRIRGELLEKPASMLLIDAGGIGYEVLVPMPTFFSLPEIGQQITLYCHFAVSETAQQLFGFSERQARDLFRLLVKVNGVGPKMAIGIMSIDTDELVACIMEDNINALVAIPGVGKKTAERLIIEMRDKLKSWSYSGGSNLSSQASSAAPSSSKVYIAEAESALTALGYKPLEASKAVSKAVSEEVTSAEELIRRALKGMLPS